MDYYPFGMLVPSPEKKPAGDYRYGFNGKENDDEVMGEDNFQDYGMRMYNPRIGRFFNVDPLTKSFPELTPYQFASNTPIAAIDLDGEEAKIVVTDNDTGYTKTFIYGIQDVNTAIIKTYEAIISYTNAECEETVIGTFNVTRDGFINLGTDSKGLFYFGNHSSDPANDKQLTIVSRKDSEYGKGTPSFTISDIYSPLPIEYNSLYFQNGKPIINVKDYEFDPRIKRVGNLATFAKFHVSGVYIKPNGIRDLGGTYGCYGIIDPAQVKISISEAKAVNQATVTPSNDEMIRFGNAIKTAEEMQMKEYGYKTDPEVEIKKRKYEKVRKNIKAPARKG